MSIILLLLLRDIYQKTKLLISIENRGAAMNVLHIASINTNTVNGFRFSVPGLISAQNKTGIKAALYNVGKPELFSKEKLEKKDFHIFQDKKIMLNNIDKPYNKPDLVVFHGVYITEYLNIYKQLIEKNIPYVIVPRVSLTKGAQSQKRIKKKIANVLFFNRFINKASAIHFLTKNEKKLSRNFEHKSFVVGNGIDLPESKTTATNKKVTNLIYTGRYDINHKGLDLLLLAINSIKGFLENREVQINFYGSNYKDGKNKLQNFIKSNKLDSFVKINKAVFGTEKEDILREADVFLATSRFEGQPMAVLEAMSYGIPCILTDGTNMLEDLIEYDAGWATKLNPDDIAESIVKALKSPSEVINKGKNARKLIEENYTWERVAEKTIEFYINVIREKKKS